MDGLIDRDGSFSIYRGATLKPQICIRNMSKMCTDACPCFGEPVELTGISRMVTGATHKLVLCSDVGTVYVSINDLRGKHVSK